MGPHDFVLLSLVFTLYGRFVLFHDLLPLAGCASEGGNGLSEEGVVGFFLSEERYTSMLEHFLGISALASSTRFF